MATFVLVHGAWHGGWCWNKVVPLLRGAGHAVYAPTLTGLGERAHLLAPDVDLSTHTLDVIGVLTCEDLDDVVLVGHSYGGMVITCVAHQAGARIGHLVYLDAFLPESGKSAADYSTRVDVHAIAESIGEGWRVPPPFQAAGFGITDVQDAAWVNSRLGDHPYRAFTQSLTVADPLPDAIERSYILTTQHTFVPHAERARLAGFNYRELFTAGHDAMVTQPAELVGMFLDLIT
jgi:pimeloyl-ACP methyl ester carboxylesterase